MQQLPSTRLHWMKNHVWVQQQVAYISIQKRLYIKGPIVKYFTVIKPYFSNVRLRFAKEGTNKSLT